MDQLNHFIIDNHLFLMPTQRPGLQPFVRLQAIAYSAWDEGETAKYMADGFRSHITCSFR